MNHIYEIGNNSLLGRRLDGDEILSYEITVENKNGRKVLYSNEKLEVQLISLEKDEEKIDINPLEINEENTN